MQLLLQLQKLSNFPETIKIYEANKKNRIEKFFAAQKFFGPLKISTVIKILIYSKKSQDSEKKSRNFKKILLHKIMEHQVL